MNIKDSIARGFWGRTQSEARSAQICVRCGQQPECKDDYEERYYRISALCPRCREEVFQEFDSSGLD